jgi:outer membrane protein assembly factor BamB
VRRVAVAGVVVGLAWAGVAGGAAASDHATVRVRSASTGRPLWTRTLAEACTRVATSDRSSLYVWDGPDLVALRWSDGSTRWRRRDLVRHDPDRGSGLAPPPPGRTVVVAEARALVGLDPRTGRTAWRRPVAAEDSALVGASRVVVVHPRAVPPSIESFDRASGIPEWTSEVPALTGRALRGVAVGPRSIALVTVATGSSPRLEVIDGETGAVRFSRDLDL